MNNKTKYLWKTLWTGKSSRYGNHIWKINKWYKTNGDLSMCKNGFHASENIIDAMKYVDMEILAKVEARGLHIDQEGKQCWEEMRIIKSWKWEKEDSIRLAIYAANLVLKNYENIFPNDDRPRKAINAAREYLKNKKNKKNTSAVASAASEAWDAVWDTRSIMSAESSAASAAYCAWTASESSEIAAIESSNAVACAAVSEESSFDINLANVKLKCHKWIIRRVRYNANN